MESYDVLIVGGGIGGLYAAWRLMKTTDLTVCVLEASHRFGGRFHTVTMPGGFPADLGAMRFLPTSHPLLHKLTKDLRLEIEKLYPKEDLEKNTPSHYFKGKHVKSLDKIVKLFSVKEEELTYFTPANRPVAASFPTDGSPFAARCAQTEMFLQDMPRALYLSLPMNPEIMNYGDGQYPMAISVAEQLAFLNLFKASDEGGQLSGYHCIKGGMERLIETIVRDLQKCPRMTLKTSYPVTSIKEECKTPFTITSDAIKDQPILSKKLILACNGLGIQQISWNSPQNRTTSLQRLFSKTAEAKSVKLFLTYERPWWEEKGFFCDDLNTDLTIKRLTAFGARGKSSDYATLLAAFTYVNTDMFYGLNQKHYSRFVNKVGDVPEDLQPSQLLVDYVHRQLQKIFDDERIPSPVCAVQRLWLGYDDSITAAYMARVGEDPYLNQWEAIKPFPDLDVFITGDTFNACTKTSLFLGWSEGALLNSERIIANHFGVDPFMEGLELQNDRMHNEPLIK